MHDLLKTISVISLLLAGVIGLIIAIDIVAGRRQRMAIMNLVWPITALYGSVLALGLYLWLGRAERDGKHGDTSTATGRMPGMSDMPAKREASSGERMSGMGGMSGMTDMPGMSGAHSMPGMAPPTSPPGVSAAASHVKRPMWQRIAVATTHCGSGCVVGDVIGETIIHFRPMTLFGREIFAGWALTYVLALFFGVIFQYFTIRPMRPELSAGAALAEAFKADVLSLTAWQIGMYGWMAIATFVIFGAELSRGGPTFWFMMQIAMLAGYATSYPMNWILVRAGIKSAM